LHRGHAVLAAALDVLAQAAVCTARPRHEHAELRLEQADLDVLPLHLWIALFERRTVELFGGQLEPPVNLDRLIDVALALLEEEQHAYRVKNGSPD
jgi:hypothetical protein